MNNDSEGPSPNFNEDWSLYVCSDMGKVEFSFVATV